MWVFFFFFLPPFPSPYPSHAWSLGIFTAGGRGQGGHVSFTRHQERLSAGGWELGQNSALRSLSGQCCDSLWLEWEAPLNIISASSLFFCSINNWLIPNDSVLVKRKLHLGAVCSHLTCNLHLADCESVSLWSHSAIEDNAEHENLRAIPSCRLFYLLLSLAGHSLVGDKGRCSGQHPQALVSNQVLMSQKLLQYLLHHLLPSLRKKGVLGLGEGSSIPAEPTDQNLSSGGRSLWRPAWACISHAQGHDAKDTFGITLACNRTVVHQNVFHLQPHPGQDNLPAPCGLLAATISSLISVLEGLWGRSCLLFHLFRPQHSEILDHDWDACMFCEYKCNKLMKITSGKTELTARGTDSVQQYFFYSFQALLCRKLLCS